VRSAVDRGVLLALNSDAHDRAQIGDLMRYAVGNARRGWATAEQVVNARSFDDLQRWLARGSAP